MGSKYIDIIYISEDIYLYKSVNVSLYCQDFWKWLYRFAHVHRFISKITFMCGSLITIISTKFTMFLSVKFLEVIKPFCSILPEIAKPERKVSTSSH